MKNLKSILCASLLTLAMSSASFGRAGDITSKPGDITSKPGDITSKPGDITSKPGDITSLTDEAYNALMGILNSILG
jgi:hypothetical protein